MLIRPQPWKRAPGVSSSWPYQKHFLLPELVLSNQSLLFYFMNSLGNFFFFCLNGITFLFSHFQRKSLTEMQPGWNMVMTKAHCLAALLTMVQKETLWALLDRKGPWPEISFWVGPLRFATLKDCQIRTDSGLHFLSLDSLPIEKLQRLPMYFTIFEENFLKIACSGSLCLWACKCAYATSNMGEMLLS